MARSHKILGFLFVTIVGVYGCAKAPSGPTQKDSSPEARMHRLEEEARAAIAARDQFRQKLIAVEERQAQLQKQLDAERSALKAELKARTSERDSITNQYDGFRRSLKELIAQAEGTLPAPSLSQPSAPVGLNLAPMPAEVGHLPN